MDEISSIHMIVKHCQDRDESDLKLLGRVLQIFHGPNSPARRGLELDIMAHMIDCYESLGRFDEAAQMKLQRVVVAHENQVESDARELVAHAGAVA